jgi:formaldehyde-activating enzyme involved in methanogenesis
LYTSTIYGKTVGKNISLNMATLQNASKELIAKTIIHEILHVYLNDSNMQDHIKIASGFVGEMALFLEKSYGMNLQEAKSICASGLAKIPNYELILKTIDSNLTREKVDNTISKFSNTSNTKQYGTYCN